MYTHTHFPSMSQWYHLKLPKRISTHKITIYCKANTVNKVPIKLLADAISKKLNTNFEYLVPNIYRNLWISTQTNVTLTRQYW
jgi:hypothetical protein